ncbi:MAG: hypothetical protein K6E51_12320 [Treponema sp.]|nr:hypothetical protein [Treponema sp.]
MDDDNCAELEPMEEDTTPFIEGLSLSDTERYIFLQKKGKNLTNKELNEFYMLQVKREVYKMNKWLPANDLKHLI